MPKSRRSNRRPYHAPHTPVDVARARGGGAPRVETSEAGEWAVRQVNSPENVYRCPGCQHLIAPRTDHVVAWQLDDWRGAAVGLDERRHWHTACWTKWGRRR